MQRQLTNDLGVNSRYVRFLYALPLLAVFVGARRVLARHPYRAECRLWLFVSAGAITQIIAIGLSRRCQWFAFALGTALSKTEAVLRYLGY